jgi:AcrR family transcriptional regulator
MSSPTPTKKRGPYAKTARTRQLAIDTAFELFSTTGYRGATLTDVADRMGMTLTGLQHHFADKDLLLAAVLEERDRRSRAENPIEPDEDATEKLVEIAVRNMHSPGLTELHCVLSAEATSPDHPAHEYFVERYRREREAGTRYFQRLIDQGRIGAALEASSLAAHLIAVADGLQLQWLLDQESIDLAAEIRRFLTAVVPSLAAGLPPTPSGNKATPRPDHESAPV